jgi:hypothetical protein
MIRITGFHKLLRVTVSGRTTDPLNAYNKAFIPVPPVIIIVAALSQ